MLSLLLVILGFLAITVAYLTISRTHSQSEFLSTAGTFGGAEAGLQRAVDSILAQGISCSDMNERPNLTNVVFNDGMFNITAEHVVPEPDATLTGGIGAGDNSIAVSSTNGYAAFGRIYVDSEAIDYSQIDVGQRHFLNVKRGAGDTAAASHAAGAKVEQNQCMLTAKSGQPNLTNPVSTRTVKRSVALGLDSGWITGYYDYYTGALILRSKGGDWFRAGYANIPKKTFRGVKAINRNDAWAVGDRGNIIHWNGVGWNSVSSGVTKTLYGVDCTSSSNCWAVGASKTFVRMVNGSWTTSDFTVNPQVPSTYIRSVSCSSPDSCWAVGNSDKTYGALFVQWKKNKWQRYVVDKAVVPAKTLYSVKCIKDDDCWAVGSYDAKSLFVHWNGTTWTRKNVATTAVPAKSLTSVDCVSSNDCWAVGSPLNGALFARWNGNSWNRVMADSSVPSQTLYGVSCGSTNNCWAVGRYKTVAHWDGISWKKTILDPSVPNKTFYAVSMLNTPDFKKEPVYWKEVYNTEVTD
jgi:hypothetical protein